GPLGDLSRAPRVGVHALAEAKSLRLPADASFLLSRVDGKTSAQDLLRLIPGSRRAAAKILYTLIYCGFIEFPESPVTRNAAGGEVEASAPDQTSRHRELVHSTYRRTDWLSHYDLLGLTLDATPKQIDEAYSQLRGLFDPVLSERPDLSDCRRELIVLSRRLRVAYEVLSRPSSRERYDTEIRRAEALLPPGSGEEGAVRPEATERSAKVRRWTASKNYKRAQELIEKNDFFPAIEMLEEAIRFVPDNGRYRLLLGRAQMKNRWWAEEGMANLEEAARLEPRSAEIQSALAEAYLERGAPEKALPYARQALNVANPANKGRYRDLELRAEQAAQLGAAEQTSGRSRRGIA
ncbi:MAG TPA: hypothetical protein VJA66_18620, partial [Thermoanaerobaculia bacterium]